MLLHLSDKSHIAAKYARHWFLKNSVFFELSWKYGALSSRTKLRLLQPLAWEKYSYRERELFFFAVKKTAGAPQLRKALPVKAMWSEQQSCVFPSLCASRVKELHIKSWQVSMSPKQASHHTTQGQQDSWIFEFSWGCASPSARGRQLFFYQPLLMMQQVYTQYQLSSKAIHGKSSYSPKSVECSSPEEYASLDI